MGEAVGVHRPEESATRAHYRYKNAGHYQWAVVIAGPAACEATLSGPKADDPIIADIAKTLATK